MTKTHLLPMLALVAACTTTAADDDATAADDDATADDDSTSDDDTTGDDDSTSDDDTAADDDSSGDDDSAGDDDDSGDDDSSPSLDAAGWWNNGVITETGGSCGFDGTTPIAYHLWQDAGTWTVGRPALVLSTGTVDAWSAPCTVNGSTLNCTRTYDTSTADGVLQRTVDYSFAVTDETASATVAIDATCLGGLCSSSPECDTAYTHSMERLPTPGQGCSAPTYPADAPDLAPGLRTVSATVSMWTEVGHDTDFPARDDSNTSMTTGAGAAATWSSIEASWTVEGPDVGRITVTSTEPELLPTSTYFDSNGAGERELSIVDRRYVDTALLVSGQHPTVDGLGVIVAQAYRPNPGSPGVSLVVDEAPNDFGAAAGGSLYLPALRSTYVYANLCPGQYTATWDVDAGACWVDPEDAVDAVTSIPLAVAPDSAALVSFTCPW